MRVAAVLLLAVVAGLAAAQDEAVLPERQTSCWRCHADADPPPPLASLFDLLPVDAGGRIGEPFDVSVNVRNAWRHEMHSIDAVLDLDAAPSLAFASGRPSERQEADVTVGPSGDMARRAHTVLCVPQGATRITFVVQPDGVVSPDIRLWLYPGATEPTGRGLGPFDAAGSSETVTFTDGPAGPLGGHGYGNWTVEIEIEQVNTTRPAVQPPLEARFRVQLEAEFAQTGEREQARTHRDIMHSESATTLSWRLVATDGPGDDETVRLRTVVHVHYDHATSQDDDEWAFKNATLYVVEDDKVWLRAQGVHSTPPPVITGISLSRIGEAVGYVATFLLVASLASGGLFGRASRRWFNRVFGTAKRRVAFHNFLSYGILLAATVHLVLFVVEVRYHWTLGLIWGGLGIAALLGLGVTGAMQVPLIRRWGFAPWRWTHLALALAAVLFTVVHILLDGANFTTVQDAVGWEDPLAPAQGDNL